MLGDAPRLSRIAEVDAHEGPVYVADEDALYFTTLPRPGVGPHALGPDQAPGAGRTPTTCRWSCRRPTPPTGWRSTSTGALVVCEQGSRWEPARISRLDRGTGERETVVEDWRGLPFNSPNDVVVASDGAIWFTDPSYGHLQGFRPRPGRRRLRLPPRPGNAAKPTVVADGFDKPNGLAFSPDERVLYVTDSGANQEPGSYYVDRPHHIKAFDVLDGRRLGGERLFAVTTPGFPRRDQGRQRRAACTRPRSPACRCSTPTASCSARSACPGAVNFCFGGRRTRPAADHDRHGGLGRRTRPRKEPDR